MIRNHIFIETLYEYKRSRRNIIFWMFVILGIAGITLHIFTPLSGLNSGKSLEGLLQGPAIEWVARVTLSDRDREHDAANKEYVPQDVVADAMKWVKVKE